MPTYSLTVRPYLDQHNRCYKKIITINAMPSGALGQYVRRINAPKLSPFKDASPCCPSSGCLYALAGLGGCRTELMCVDDVPDLFGFLSTNGYTIDSDLTKMMQKSAVRLDNDLLCFITI